MKSLIILMMIFILVFFGSTFGQDLETLVDGEVDHGFFISQSTKLTKIDGKFTPILGFRMGWIVNHSFVIGAAGYSMLDKNETDFIVSEQAVEILLAYGGLQLSYINNSNKLIHYEIGTLIGIGGLNYRDHSSGSGLPNSDHIFVIEPEVVSVLNISKSARISSGLSYRWINKIDFEEVVKNSDLSGLTVSLNLSIGAF